MRERINPVRAFSLVEDLVLRKIEITGRIFFSADVFGNVVRHVAVLRKFRRIHQIERSGYLGYTGSRLEIGREVAGCLTLCRDEDNAIGTSGTVQGSGRHVFQDGNALDVGRIYLIEVRNRIDYAVDHNQRRVARTDGPGATDLDGRFRTGFSRR